MSIKNTVLILGGTSGIGRGLARAIHSQGKTVIVTGRRLGRLSALATELPGLKTSAFDFSNITELPSNINGLFHSYPDIDTVIVSAGIQTFLLFNDNPTPNYDIVSQEVAINLTAPIVLCQILVPVLLKKPKPCSIILISSGLAFVPVPFFPVYGPTKAALHAFAIALRSQTAGTNINVTEVFPPYVETELLEEHKARVIEMSGGPDKAPKPMPLSEFTEQLIRKLDTEVDGKPLSEVGIGAFPEMAITAWRGAIGPLLEKFHVVG